MTYNKHNIAVKKIARTPGTFHAQLSTIFFTSKFTAATDSFGLVEVSIPKDSKSDGVTDSILLSVESLAGLNPKAGATIQLQNITKDHADLISLENKGPIQQITKAPIVKEKFPEYAHMFSKEKPRAEVVLDADRLIKILSILGPITSDHHVKIRLFGQYEPVQIVIEGNQPARALLAAVRTK